MRSSRRSVSRTEGDHRSVSSNHGKGESFVSSIVEEQQTLRAQLDSVLKAVTDVRESVDERFTPAQGRIGHVRKHVLEEVRIVLSEQLKSAAQRETVDVVCNEVKKIVHEQVSEIVRREMGTATA